MMSLVDFCLLLPEYLGRNPNERDKVRSQLLARLRSGVASENELRDVLNQLGLQSRLWTAEDLQDFENAGRVSFSAESGKAPQTQDFTAFPTYIPLSVWQRIQACDDDYSKAIVLAKFLGALGLRWPSEQTVAFFQAFVLVASTQDHSKDTPPAIHGMYKASKKLLKLVIEKAEVPFGSPPWPWRLPKIQEELDAIWLKNALGMEKPMFPPPLSVERLAVQVGDIPQRKNHKALSEAYRAQESIMAMQTLGDVAKSAFSLVKRQGHLDRKGEARITMLTSPSKEKQQGALVPCTQNPPAVAEGIVKSSPPRILKALPAPIEARGSDLSKQEVPFEKKKDSLPPTAEASGVLEAAEKLGNVLNEEKATNNTTPKALKAKPAAAVHAAPKGVKRKPAADMEKAPSKKPAARVVKPDETVPKIQEDLVLMAYHTTAAVAIRQRNGKQLLQVKKPGCTLEENRAFAEKLLQALKKGESLDYVLEKKKKWINK